MKIKSEKSYGIVGTSILDINNKEMRQMCDIKERITQVLISHKDEKLKNEYLTDDELKMLHAILRVFTREYSESQTSAFDGELKAIEEEEKNMTKEEPVVPEHTLL